MIKVELDTKEFESAMRQYLALSKKDEETIVKDRAGKVAFELFKQFRGVTPKTSELRALGRRLGWRLKRKFKGASAAAELSRRVRARFAAAAGWIPAVRKLSKRSVSLRKKNPKGSVSINLSEPSVTIINSMKEAVAAESKHHLLQRSVDAQAADMKKYIERKMEQRAKQFSAR